MAEDPKTQTVVSISPNVTGRTNAAPLVDDPLVPALHVVVRSADGSDPQPTTIAYDDVPTDVLKLPFLEFLKALPQVRLTVLDARMPPEQRKALEAENLKAETERLAALKTTLAPEVAALETKKIELETKHAALEQIDTDFAAFKATRGDKQPAAKP